MPARILIGAILTALLAVSAAFPQAAAESVLLNQSSATATAKTGSTLGHALNSSGNKLGNQIQSLTQSKVVTTSKVVTHTQRASQTRRVVSAKTPAGAAKPPSNNASMITSVQGGRVTHSSPAAPSHN